MKEKKCRSLALVVLFLCLFASAGLCVCAAGDSVVGTLQVMVETAEVREEADENAALVGTLEAGTAVIVEETDGAWSRVVYQETEGYVPNKALGLYAGGEAEELTREMNDVAEAEQRFLEEIDLAERERRNSAIWEIVIAVLLAAIFGVSAVTALRSAKGEERKAESRSGRKDETE